MIHIKIKFGLILLVFVFLLQSNSFAFEGVDVSDFISEVKTYNNNVFPEFSNENWLNNILKRKFGNGRTIYYKKSIKFNFK